MALFAGLAPTSYAVRKTAGLIDVPVVCGGVIVAPGDVVVADEEGIVVLPAARAEALRARARARALGL